jgi:hypothetical protein
MEFISDFTVKLFQASYGKRKLDAMQRDLNGAKLRLWSRNSILADRLFSLKFNITSHIVVPSGIEIGKFLSLALDLKSS